MNSIVWTRKAARQLLKLQQEYRTVIHTAVDDELHDLTAARNVKATPTAQYGYRLRVGRYRVLFHYDGEVHIVSIEEVKKRDERTY